MRPVNLLTVYQGAAALESLPHPVQKQYKTLKEQEIGPVRELCALLRQQGCGLAQLDGFFVDYTIEGIGKEFDLLRFGKNRVVNIELKSELPPEGTRAVCAQLKKNSYYLRLLERKVSLFTYVQGVGFYRYEQGADRVRRCDAAVVARCLQRQQVDESIDPDREFVPSRYLISPFNQTDAFLQSAYFLTGSQQTIKKEVLAAADSGSCTVFCLAAGAGTGKTLLVYDMARTLLQRGQRAVVLHPGSLNAGQQLLNESRGWDIRPLLPGGALPQPDTLQGCSLLFVDEAQRLPDDRITALVTMARAKGLPVFLAYDPNRFLPTQEQRDIRALVEETFPGLWVAGMRLTNRIRTNRHLASFVTNLLHIGRSDRYLDYDCVSLEYRQTDLEVRQYFEYLSGRGWTCLACADSTDPAAPLGDYLPGEVVGQEFRRVALVMDESYRYQGNRLAVGPGDAAARALLYQIATRAVDELKIIVLNNPELYCRLQEILHLQDRGEE